MTKFCKEVLSSIEAAVNQGLEVPPPPGILTGFAGQKLTGLLQRLPKVTEGDYLEIGTYQGSSLLHTALANPDITCYGIDNFAFFDPSGRNKQSVIDRATQLSVKNYTLIEKDFEEALSEINKKIGTYFIDGPHDYRSQLICLAYAPKFLSRNGVILVDDANYPHVRQATADFLAIWPEYKLVFEAYTPCHPVNMTQAQLSEAQDGWWDGVHVIVHDPEDHFEGLVPPAPGNQRFIRDHEIHGRRWAPVGAQATDFTAALARPWELPRALGSLIRNHGKRSTDLKKRFRYCNTESEGLPLRIARAKTTA